MLNRFITVFLAVLPLLQCVQIHKHMSNDEVLRTFQTGHDNVPDYEVIQLFHTLHKRDIEDNAPRRVKVNAFGRNMSLYLTPADGLLAGVSTPVWTVEPDVAWPEKTRYTLHPDVLSTIGRAYQDVSGMSAIVAYEGEDGKTLIQGNLLDDIVIRPLPHHLRDTVSREAQSSDHPLPDGDEGDDFQRSHHHVVYKRPAKDMDPTRGDIKAVKRERRNVTESVNERSKRSMPDIVYPEILTIVDYRLYTAIGKNLEDIARYVLAFWNAVDLRYRLLEEPMIRLNIAGIIVSVKSGGTPYLEDYITGSTDVDADLALVAMSQYFYRESYIFNFSTYDLAIAMTQLDMCNIGYNGVCDRSTLGYAYEWGACNRSHVDMNTEAVGIIEDNGGYSAIIPAAHEVAHLMGAPHDGLAESLDCPAYHKYLMSSGLSQTMNTFQWSNCSLRYFYDYFSSPDATCVYNKPPIDQPLVRLLPGETLTLDEQCEKIRGTKACRYDARVCTELECRIPGIDECAIVSAAAEGSSCGIGLHCINAHCVSKNETIVPYTPATTMLPFHWSFRRPGFTIPERKNFTDNPGIPDETYEEEDTSISETNDR